MQGNEEKKTALEIQKLHLYVCKKDKYLRKKYKDFKFYMIRQWKATQSEMWYKMSGRRLQKTYVL